MAEQLLSTSASDAQQQPLCATSPLVSKAVQEIITMFKSWNDTSSVLGGWPPTPYSPPTHPPTHPPARPDVQCVNNLCPQSLINYQLIIFSIDSSCILFYFYVTVLLVRRSKFPFNFDQAINQFIQFRSMTIIVS